MSADAAPPGPTRFLRGATFVVADPAASAARYVRWFGYRLAESGVVPEELARAWDAPAMAGRAYCVVEPGPGPGAMIRFISGSPIAPHGRFSRLGWNAIEICVEDVHAAHAGMKGSPFEVIGPPPLTSALGTVLPMQVEGLDQDVIFLTEIKDKTPGNGLPRPRAPFDDLFIMVCGVRDAAATYGWYERHLGVEPRAAFDYRYDMINRAFGLPAEHLTHIRTAKGGGYVCLEFDSMPAAAGVRSSAPGELPFGLAMATFALRDLGQIRDVPHARIAPRGAAGGRFYGAGAGAGVLRDPDGNLIEVVEDIQ